MRPGMLVVLLVAALVGALAYRTFWPPEGPLGDAAGEPGRESTPARPPPRLGDSDRAATERRLNALEQRLEGQGRQLADIRELVERLTAGAEDPGNSFLKPLDAGPADASFDERTLKALEAHMTELRRRQQESHRRNLVERNVDQLALTLAPDERRDLVDAVREYQRRTRSFWADMEAQGITDRPAQLAELEKLRTRLADVVRRYVDAADVEATLDGLIGRASLVRQPEDPPR